jgi:hypothetical protein
VVPKSGFMNYHQNCFKYQLPPAKILIWEDWEDSVDLFMTSNSGDSSPANLLSQAFKITDLFIQLEYIAGGACVTIKDGKVIKYVLSLH